MKLCGDFWPLKNVLRIADLRGKELFLSLKMKYLFLLSILNVSAKLIKTRDDNKLY